MRGARERKRGREVSACVCARWGGGGVKIGSAGLVSNCIQTDLSQIKSHSSFEPTSDNFESETF